MRLKENSIMSKCKGDSLGDRMKTYEGVTRTHLVRRTPVIIRIDGKAFHTFTRGFNRPFDNILINAMWETCKYLCANIQGCKIAYAQSDEISLLLTDYEKVTTSSWFDNNIQKMVSVSSSMATMAFNRAFIEGVNDECIQHNLHGDDVHPNICALTRHVQKMGSAMFDSRVFNIPKEEVCNYFIWRQQDASRNSVSMVASSKFSHKQLHCKSVNEMQEMLFQEKGINWRNDYPTYEKRGACIVKETYKLEETDSIRSRWIVDKDIPIFTQDREYIEKFL